MDGSARGQRLAPLEQAFKKAAVLIQSGGLGLIVIDLGLIVINLGSLSSTWDSLSSTWAHCHRPGLIVIGLGAHRHRPSTQ